MVVIIQSTTVAAADGPPYHFHFFINTKTNDNTRYTKCIIVYCFEVVKIFVSFTFVLVFTVFHEVVQMYVGNMRLQYRKMIFISGWSMLSIL